MTTQKVKRTKVIYKWASGSLPVPAQVVGEELARLEVRPGQCHRTKDVLDSARHPDSPLHGCFQWDDEKAAESHRLAQCRLMLRSIAIVIVREEVREKQPVYVHLTDAKGPRYVRVEKVKSDEEIRESALEEALALLNGLRRRYQFLTELGPVLEAIEEVTERRK